MSHTGRVHASEVACENAGDPNSIAYWESAGNLPGAPEGDMTDRCSAARGVASDSPTRRRCQMGKRDLFVCVVRSFAALRAGGVMR